MPPEDQGARGPEDNSSSPLDSRFSTSGDSIDNAAQASGEIEPHQDLGHRPGNREASTELEKEASDRLSAYWQANSLQNPLSEDAKHLIKMSWRPGTESSYKSNWRRWIRYAREHGIEEIAPSLDQVIEYLTLFNEVFNYKLSLLYSVWYFAPSRGV